MCPRTILVKLALATARLRHPPETNVETKYKCKTSTVTKTNKDPQALK